MAGQTRRTARNCEEVEQHGQTLQRLIVSVREVVDDGFVNADEDRLLEDAMGAALTSYRPLPATASCLDNGARLIGALASTMDVTAWVARCAREATEDEAALLAA